MSGLVPLKKQFSLYVKNSQWNYRKDDKTIQVFRSIIGMIEYVGVKKVTPTGEQDFTEYEALKMMIENGEEQYFISMNAAWSTASNIFNCLPLIDVKNQVEIIAYKGDSGFDAIMVKQNGLRVANYYTKNSPNGKPEWVKLPNGGFDKTAELEFFKASLTPFMERLIRSKATTPQVAEAETNFNPAEGFDMPEF